jgi:two-component system sensor histidine kinase VanS
VRGRRMTIRVRLTLIYGMTFALAVAALLTVIYVIMSRWPEYRFGMDVTDQIHAPTPSADLSAVPEPADAVSAVAVPVVSSEADLLSILLRASGLTLAVGTLTALVLGWIVAGRMLLPIRRINGMAARIAAGNLHQRVGLDGPADEVKELADTFDGMLARLEAAFEAQRRFTANASHELLTPLATSQALLDVAAAHPEACDVPGLIGKLLAVSRRSEDIVESLLTLARADQTSMPAELVDLDEIVRSALPQVRAEAAARSVTLRAAIEPTAVYGDRRLLGSLLVNLLLNGVRHNRPGGHVELAVRADGQLSVSNTGPLVPAERIDELFEPFVRGANRARVDGQVGHGLGLPIVRSVTAVHGGTIRATPNSGGGLTVTVRLRVRLPAEARESPRPTPDGPGRLRRSVRRTRDRSESAAPEFVAVRRTAIRHDGGVGPCAS